MTGIDLTAVMDDLAAAVDSALASDKTCYGYPVEDLTVGDAVVGYPDDPINVSTTFRRGMDRATLPVFLVAGMPQDKATRDTIADYITGAGSLVTAIESYSTTSWSSASVTTISVDRYDPVGRPPLVAVRFNVDILSR